MKKKSRPSPSSVPGAVHFQLDHSPAKLVHSEAERDQDQSVGQQHLQVHLLVNVQGGRTGVEPYCKVISLSCTSLSWRSAQKEQLQHVN